MKRMTAQRVTIDDIEYAIMPFGAWRAANISGELAKVLGPVVAGLAPALFADGTDILKQDISRFVPAIITGVQSLDGAVIERMMKKLLIEEKNVSCSYRDEDGRTHQELLTWDNADEIFCQDLDAMFKLAYEVIRINFNGFFRKLFAQYGNQESSDGGQTQKSMGISKRG